MSNDTRKYCEEEQQTHVHEFLGSTRLAELEEDPHNHRFAGVSDEVIPIGNCQHIHEIRTKTDFYEDHFHEICVRSGPAVFVDEDRHVHFVCGTTTEVEDHEHDFIFATLIEDPIG
ncbi:hypothetical protein P22_0765 [Propionispora sp. 2/2-37]|uniref:YmaF family protein n=1 Tax=Propionispora sp. 2/2-37 TaxID=1677858 RepID=UPI0006BB7756|nr:YmaF family protein [Propionispora sp. 2/2-37]CUH94699.1 hypothetical protein P22_0765 [Propionispora sp. 2/2-37]